MIIFLIFIMLFTVCWFWYITNFLIKEINSMYDKLYYYADKINYALDEIGKIKKELKKIGVLSDKTQS